MANEPMVRRAYQRRRAVKQLVLRNDENFTQETEIPPTKAQRCFLSRNSGTSYQAQRYCLLENRDTSIQGRSMFPDKEKRYFQLGKVGASRKGLGVNWRFKPYELIGRTRLSSLFN